MSYKIEKAGYEYLGFELGQNVMYKGKETIVVGFDKDKSVACPIAIKHENSRDIRGSAFVDVVLDIAHENKYKYTWVEPTEIKIIENEKPMEKKMTKADLEGKWVKVVKGDGRHFHTDDLIQIKNGGIRALDGGDTLSYWCDSLDESFSEKELRNKLLNSYAGLSIEYLGDYPQPQSKPKSNSSNPNKKSNKTNLTTKVVAT